MSWAQRLRGTSHGPASARAGEHDPSIANPGGADLLGAMSRTAGGSGDIEQLLRVIAATGPQTRIIELIAANSGDGTSTVACQLASAGCQVTDGAVLLLDLEAGSGGVRRALGQTVPADADGLIEIGTLSLRADAPRGLARTHGDFASMPLRLSRAGSGNLFLAEHLSSGESDRRAGPAITPDLLRTFLQEEGLLGTAPAPVDRSGSDTSLGVMRQLFASVFIDAPALSKSLDGLLAASSADAVILVLAAEETRIPVARNLRDRVAEAGGSIIGLILNRRRYYIPKALYDRL